MFTRVKPVGKYRYLQVVENYWENGKTRQRIIATLGRLDRLQESGDIDGILASASRFSRKLTLLGEVRGGLHKDAEVVKIGPALVFERLWKELGMASVIRELLNGRKFGFDVERAIFLTVLHRLIAPGSDRAAEKWREGYRIGGTEELQLHHLYRAMAWVGEALPAEEQEGATPFVLRCTKDLIEERLFSLRRDLFSSLELVFFDTTSLYFEGAGGETLGEYGHSKDHRPDLKQMVVGAVLDQDGRPICCELWPGNTADVKTLIPVVERLQSRFGVERVCVIADRGMISKETMAKLEKPERDLSYILGVRMRRQKEVREEVLGRRGRYRVVREKGTGAKDASPLSVKEVLLRGRRYVVCYNEDEAKKQAGDREAILAALEDRLSRQGAKSLIGNKGYRKYLSMKRGAVAIDRKKVDGEARYDGKWVLTTNTDLPTAEVALRYKELWEVEALFRSIKSVLATRPIYHKSDETIRGHVFCSFLALMLRKELQERLRAKGFSCEWADVIRDVDNLSVTVVKDGEKVQEVRSSCRGDCGKVFQAVGVAVPPMVRTVAAP
jgi:hypothetical protein